MCVMFEKADKRANVKTVARLLCETLQLLEDKRLNCVVFH